MYSLLIAGRISEIVGELTAQDDRSALNGPRADDLELLEWEGHEVALFTVSTSKRNGLFREVALPLDPRYEAFTGPVVKFFQSRDPEEYVFKINRFKLGRPASEYFKGYIYRIDPYPGVPGHYRPFTHKALRSVRGNELRHVFGFDGFDLSCIAGWTMRTMTGISSSAERYLRKNWDEYFPKLLKERTDLSARDSYK